MKGKSVYRFLFILRFAQVAPDKPFSSLNVCKKVTTLGESAACIHSIKFASGLTLNIKVAGLDSAHPLTTLDAVLKSLPNPGKRGITLGNWQALGPASLKQSSWEAQVQSLWCLLYSVYYTLRIQLCFPKHISQAGLSLWWCMTMVIVTFICEGP